MSVFSNSGRFEGAIKPTLAAMGGGAAVGIVALLGPGNALLVVAGFAVLATVIIAIYVFLRKRQEKRAVQRGDEEIYERIREQPSHVADPKKLGDIAALSVKLEEVVRTYRELGHSLSDKSLPWYLLVGETGSGKSEAIRHSGINFPPGMNKEQQGSGGTVNMDWWFTENGIILDTAGRYVGQDESLEELKRFLQFLRKIRRACPINGMLLVIPAESLLKDSVDVINTKSGRIAKRLDLMRRALGVRFPVFVIISKSDLIPGFRTFFSDLSGLDQQSQMLGWSNPGTLNDPFDPAAVEKHLQDVRDRLVKRRTSLLLDPVHTESPDLSRLDQVDALYEFPQALLRLGPNLRLYLQPIFTKSKFSPEPLFLRGMYFTSSMEEGAEVDDAVAKLLGVPVETLQQDGRAHKRDHAVFLTDLFNRKVFVEKGLVTRSAEADPEGILRRQKIKLLGAAAAVVLILIGVTWIQYDQLNARIGDQKKFWRDLEISLRDRDSSTKSWKILSDKAPYQYWGQTKVTLKGEDLELWQVFNNRPEVENRIKIPWVFEWLPARIGETNLYEDLQPAKKAVYDSVVLQPLVNAVVTRMHEDVRNGDESIWDDDDTVNALAELVRIQAAGTGYVPRTRADAGNLQLDRLFNYALKGSDKTDLGAVPSTDRDTLQETQTALYNLPDRGIDLLKACVNGPNAIKWDQLNDIVESFCTHVDKVASGQVGKLETTNALVKAAENFKTAEDKLLALGNQATPPPEEYHTRVTDWKLLFDALAKTKQSLERCLAVAIGPDERLGDAWMRQQNDARNTGNKQFNRLIDLFGSKPATNPSAQQGAQETTEAADWRNRSENINSQLETARNNVNQTGEGVQAKQDVDDLNKLYEDYLKPSEGGPGSRLFQVRCGIYSEVNDMVNVALPNDGKPRDAVALAAALVRLDSNTPPENVKKIRNDINGLVLTFPLKDKLKNVCDDYMIAKVYLPVYRRDAIAALVRDLSAGNVSFEALVENITAQSPPGFRHSYDEQRPLVPLASDSANPKSGSPFYRLGYHPDRAMAFISAIDSILSASQPGTNEILNTRASYVDSYVKYWETDLAKEVTPVGPSTWQELQRSLNAANVHDNISVINSGLTKIAAARREALDERVTKVLDSTGVLTARLRSIIPNLGHPEIQADVLNNKGDQIVKNWTALPANAASARRIILNGIPKDVRDKYFYWAPNDPQSLYWNQLSLRCLDVINSNYSQGPDPSDPIKRLTDDGKLFPFDTKAKTELQARDIPQLKQALYDVNSALASSELTDAPQIQKCLNDLRGIDPNAVPQNTRRIMALCRAFGIDDRPIPAKCDVWILPANLQRGTPSGTGLVKKGQLFADDEFPNLRLTPNAKPTAVAVADGVDPNPPLVTLYYGTGADNSVVLEFLRTNSTSGPKVPLWSGPWAPIHLALQGFKPTGEAKNWYGQVVFQDAGKTYSLWVKLVFERELPKLGEDGQWAQ